MGGGGTRKNGVYDTQSELMSALPPDLSFYPNPNDRIWAKMGDIDPGMRTALPEPYQKKTKTGYSEVELNKLVEAFRRLGIQELGRDVQF